MLAEIKDYVFLAESYPIDDTGLGQSLWMLSICFAPSCRHDLIGSKGYDHEETVKGLFRDLSKVPAKADAIVFAILHAVCISSSPLKQCP